MEYSKIKEYEVWNFMSIKHAKVSFDERNIITFKGFNDSGKSAMIRALEVCLYNRYPSSQSKFIRDDTEYFRVLVTFEDGVQILKDKYANGKGLYEMYKNGTVVYSTKKNGVLTKITAVPEIIANYLGLIQYDDIYLNSRSCFEKQLLVETKGKENYGFLNSVLKSEELSVAGALLNTDKNKLLSEKSRYEAEYDIFSDSYGKYGDLSTESIERLEALDKKLDSLDEAESKVQSIRTVESQLEGIPDLPDIRGIDLTQVNEIQGVLEAVDKIEKLPNIPELKSIDCTQVTLLSNIKSASQTLEDLNKKNLEKDLSLINFERVKGINEIANEVRSLSELESNMSKLDEELNSLENELEEIKSEASKNSFKVLRCKNCGALVLDGESHEDMEA